ncbi:helix-turn-helix domain-containing protein [Nocardia seriolae]|nr:XRE family transcriptional regulator [Nocardia seriolae]QUN15314.1 helix-turn-helix transcriptional regulator [Nocardia seriolae]WKY51037.1 XRE family transcriptional regulator [Nocardia seriolae]BAW05044.1 conserved hypothetical protein [Nocardia seriolae]
MSSPNQIVGRNVDRLRRLRGMSASELARRAGIAKATVLAIEAGSANPTVETLHALATSLEVTLPDLVTEDTAAPTTEIRRAATDPVHRLGETAVRRLTTLYGPQLVYVFTVTVDGNGTHTAAAHETGSVECLYVLSGIVTAGTDEDRVELGPGDWIRFPADRPHSYRAGNGAAQALLVVARNEIPEAGEH